MKPLDKHKPKLIRRGIKCHLCGGNFMRITNTHLWHSHKITVEEYKSKFPDAQIDAPGLADSRVDHLRGKTYEEVYGDEKAKDLREIRSDNALEQMKDPTQIEIRQDKCGYEMSEEQKEKLRKVKTVTGASNYRIRALNYYGLECARCSFSSENEKDFIVHHKDLLNINTELADHSLDNLEVLCRPCHGKLHNELTEVKGRFTGIPNIEKGVHYIFKGLKDEFGLDLNDENFKDTPKRVARAYREIFSGLMDTEKQVGYILRTAFPSEGYKSLVMSSSNTVYSMCPHHLLPVEYKVAVAYIPSKNGLVLGASKLSRLVDLLGRRPVLQETFTQDIVDYLEQIKPRGVATVVRGIHYCMRMRGIRSRGWYETSALSGDFMDEPAARKEFFDLLKLRRSSDNEF